MFAGRIQTTAYSSGRFYLLLGYHRRENAAGRHYAERLGNPLHVNKQVLVNHDVVKIKRHILTQA